jgi:hypothetical protein
MVGQLPLEQHIGVRIPGGQPGLHFPRPSRTCLFTPIPYQFNGLRKNDLRGGSQKVRLRISHQPGHNSAYSYLFQQERKGCEKFWLARPESERLGLL